MRASLTALARMTQPFPEPLHFDPSEGSEASKTPDLLSGRRGIVAVLVAPEAHASGWASRTAIALAEAALAAGCPTGLVDLGLEHPSLHTAASIDATEGLSDIILFGASLGRVSGWSPAGARVVPAGTLVGDPTEILDGSAWAEIASQASDGGCVLAYAPTAFAEAVLSQATDMILLRHEGEEVDSLSMTPSLVLEPVPQPAEEVVAEETGAETAHDEKAPDEKVAIGIDTPEDEVETTVDLDDVVDDSDLASSPMFSPAAAVTLSPEGDTDVQGLDAEPEWPDFDVPLVVQDPGEVDPLVASAGPEPVEPSGPSVFDDITSGDDVLIITDDLGMGPQADPADEVLADTIEGLVGSGLDTLSPAGEASRASADNVVGLELPADGSGDLDLADENDESVSVPSKDRDVDAFDRLDDPWGEPPEPSPAAQTTEADSDGPVTTGAVEGVEAAGPNPFDFEPGTGETSASEQQPDVPEETEIPVAHVTRTRTRTRTKGPRPFLLILFLLLITIVAVLQWLGMLDVAGLDFLRGDGF